MSLKIKIINLLLILSIIIIILTFTEGQRSRQRGRLSTSTTTSTTQRPTRKTTTIRTTTTPRPRPTTTRRPITTSRATQAPRLTTSATTIRTSTRSRLTTPKPKKRKPSRNRNRGKQEPDTRLQCYTCYADFERIPFSVQNPAQHIYNNNCYNPSLNYTQADSEYLTRCAAGTKFCMVDITRLNNVLLSVDRRCGGATCRKTCLARGYGVIRETCTFCCNGRHTEDDPDYDEDEHGNYKCPMEPH